MPFSLRTDVVCNYILNIYGKPSKISDEDWCTADYHNDDRQTAREELDQREQSKKKHGRVES